LVQNLQIGDAKSFQELAAKRPNSRRHKKAQLGPDSDQRCCLIASVCAHFERLFTGTKRLQNPNLQGSRPNESSHDALAPIRMLAARRRTCEYPIIRTSESCLLTPQQESVSQLRIQWDWFLGSFRFAWTDDLKNYRSNDADFIGLKVNISPFQGKELTHPQTRPERHQHKRALPQGQRGQQRLNL